MVPKNRKRKTAYNGIWHVISHVIDPYFITRSKWSPFSLGRTKNKKKWKIKQHMIFRSRKSLPLIENIQLFSNHRRCNKKSVRAVHNFMQSKGQYMHPF